MRRFRVIQCLLTVALLWLPIRSAVAQSDAARAQVTAATANATNSLKSDIRASRISPTLTVAQFLERTDSTDAIDDLVETAQQIGGPRWIDDQTCQVQLELSGARVAYRLTSIAAVKPKLSPIPAAVLEKQLQDWKRKSFTATGMSISSERVQGIRPIDISPKWSAVSDSDRRQAVTAAKQDAANNVIESIRSIDIAPGQTVGQLLAREPVQQAVRDWVESRPVTQLRYDDDLQVQLTVSAPPEELLQTVLASARRIPGTTFPSDEKTIDELNREFARHVSAATGRAGIMSQVSSSTRPAMVDLPDQPPSWVFQSIDVEAVAPHSTQIVSPLRTKVTAETTATDNLRTRIDGLSLKGDLTLGAAARQDPRIADAIDRALLRARVYKVEYRADGSVMVRMMIDARDLWQELNAATN